MESIIAHIPYEPSPSFPYQYTNEIISKCESLTGTPFPEDLKWYLQNTGWRRITNGNRSLLIPNGEYLYCLQFEAAEHQAFIINRYRQHLENNTGNALPYQKNGYFPFGKISGEINPAVSYQLLISLNPENYGAVWAIISNNVSDKNIQLPPPYKIADSFTLFLQQISSEHVAKPIAQKHNEALFLKLIKKQLENQHTLPTKASGPSELLHIFLENTTPTIVDGIRNVEFQYRSNSQRIESAQQFTERVHAFTTMQTPSWQHLQRQEINTGAPQLYEVGYSSWNKNEYYLVNVNSIVGDKNQLKEVFLLHHDATTSQWTFVRRFQSLLDEVKIKGVGTFTFDDTYKWELKKKVIPAWSALPAAIHVDGEEDAMSAARISYIKEVLSFAGFKPLLEAFIFSQYQAAYNVMPDDEKTGYPVTTSPPGVWSLLGKSINVYIDGNDTFHLHTDCKWDDEHGITVNVKNWQLQ